jgi:AraC-like DNA-binding protein
MIFGKAGGAERGKFCVPQSSGQMNKFARQTVVVARTHRVVQHKSAIPGIEGLTLFSDHAFPRHSHDQFGIGIMTSGAQRSWSVIGQVESQAGDVIMLNPGEMHDGMPVGGFARGWQILYLDPELVDRETAGEVANDTQIPPVARDPFLTELVLRLFTYTTHPSPDRLATEESLLRCLMYVLRRHGLRRPLPCGSSPSVVKALHRLDAAPEAPTSLAELAALSGVSRFQLLRGFAREVGVTPHAYLVQRRVRLVRRLLAEGQTPAEAAQRAGFADQSHMTRAFVRQLGVTPGRYRAALR